METGCKDSMNSECFVFDTGSLWCNSCIRFWLGEQVRGFDSIFNSHLVFTPLPAEEKGLEKVLTLGRVGEESKKPWLPQGEGLKGALIFYSLWFPVKSFHCCNILCT